MKSREEGAPGTKIFFYWYGRRNQIIANLKTINLKRVKANIYIYIYKTENGAKEVSERYERRLWHIRRQKE